MLSTSQVENWDQSLRRWPVYSPWETLLCLLNGRLAFFRKAPGREASEVKEPGNRENRGKYYRPEAEDRPKEAGTFFSLS